MHIVHNFTFLKLRCFTIDNILQTIGQIIVLMYLSLSAHEPIWLLFLVLIVGIGVNFPTIQAHSGLSKKKNNSNPSAFQSTTRLKIFREKIWVLLSKNLTFSYHEGSTNMESCKMGIQQHGRESQSKSLKTLKKCCIALAGLLSWSELCPMQ